MSGPYVTGRAHARGGPARVHARRTTGGPEQLRGDTRAEAVRT
ncbi:hypothetical protein [Streptomyces gobitricini]